MLWLGVWNILSQETTGYVAPINGTLTNGWSLFPDTEPVRIASVPPPKKKTDEEKHGTTQPAFLSSSILKAAFNSFKTKKPPFPPARYLLLGEFLVIITDALYSNAGMDTPLNPREGLVPPFMQWWNRNLLTKRQRAVRAFLRAFIAFIGMMLLWVGLSSPAAIKAGRRKKKEKENGEKGKGKERR